MGDPSAKTQQGAFAAFVRKLLRWGSETSPMATRPEPGSSTKSKGAESLYSSYDPSTDVSSLAPSAISMGHSSHGGPNSLLIGNSFASPLSSPPPPTTASDQTPGPTATMAPPLPTTMVVSVVEPIHSPATSRAPSSRAADTASVLTIASSSKRRRRRSIDTNASTRALFAESIFSTTDVE